MRKRTGVLATIAALTLILGAGATAQSASADSDGSGGNVGFEWRIDGTPRAGMNDVTFTENFGPTTGHLDGTFASYQLGFMNSRFPAYIGLQPHEDRNGKVRMGSVFSTFAPGSTVVDAGSCSDGADGGAGVSCGKDLDMDFVYGRDYALTVTHTGDTWIGTVSDTVTKKSMRIGAWTMPAGSGLLGNGQIGFVEYYNVYNGACSLLQRIDVRLGRPTTSTGQIGYITTPWEYSGCTGKSGFSITASDGGWNIHRGFVNPALTAVQSLTVKNKTVTIGFDPWSFPSWNRYVVWVDGKYAFETYGSTVYYSYKRPTPGGMTVTTDVSWMTPTSTVKVTLEPNQPGWPTTQQTDVTPKAPAANVASAIRSISTSGNQVRVAFDEALAKNNRYLVYVNTDYQIELDHGAQYYASSITNSGGVTTITRSLSSLPSGSVVRVYLAPGAVGGSNYGQVLAGSYRVP